MKGVATREERTRWCSWCARTVEVWMEAKGSCCVDRIKEEEKEIVDVERG